MSITTVMHRRIYCKRKKTHHRKHIKSVEFRRHVKIYEVESSAFSDDDLCEEEDSKRRQQHADDPCDSDAGLDLDEKLNKRLRILDEADEEMQCAHYDSKLKRSNSGRLDWIRRSLNKRRGKAKPVPPSDIDDEEVACRTKATQTALTSFAAQKPVEKLRSWMLAMSDSCMMLAGLEGLEYGSPYTAIAQWIQSSFGAQKPGALNSFDSELSPEGECACDCTWFDERRRRRLRKSVFRMQQQYFEFHVRTKVFTRPPSSVVQYMMRLKASNSASCLLRTLIDRLDGQQKGEIVKTSDCYCRQTARIFSEYCRLLKGAGDFEYSVKPEELPPHLRLFY
ncbi:hypothetical protein Tcan_11954 [Toxocara canis]|uniref:Uncharacterized protein n=1 Tax=Toxocara canis TaxID=6265 RepID=A0A0B2VA35_TOXCA|nr:hypothetical protein Tcan_11954 [Toxocara canis]